MAMSGENGQSIFWLNPSTLPSLGIGIHAGIIGSNQVIGFCLWEQSTRDWLSALCSHGTLGRGCIVQNENLKWGIYRYEHAE